MSYLQKCFADSMGRDDNRVDTKTSTNSVQTTAVFALSDKLNENDYMSELQYSNFFDENNESWSSLSITDNNVHATSTSASTSTIINPSVGLVDTSTYFFNIKNNPENCYLCPKPKVNSFKHSCTNNLLSKDYSIKLPNVSNQKQLTKMFDSQFNSKSNNTISKKVPKKCSNKHIKKPLNAFMLYMKAKRSEVMSECTLKESAVINQILGRRWHSLSQTEQAEYYNLARIEKEMHQWLHPNELIYRSQIKAKRKRLCAKNAVNKSRMKMALKQAPNMCCTFNQNPSTSEFDALGIYHSSDNCNLDGLNTSTQMSMNATFGETSKVQRNTWPQFNLNNYFEDSSSCQNNQQSSYYTENVNSSYLENSICNINTMLKLDDNLNRESSVQSNINENILLIKNNQMILNHEIKNYETKPNGEIFNSLNCSTSSKIDNFRNNWTDHSCNNNDLWTSTYPAFFTQSPFKSNMCIYPEYDQSNIWIQSNNDEYFTK